MKTKNVFIARSLKFIFIVVGKKVFGFVAGEIGLFIRRAVVARGDFEEIITTGQSK